jgi:type 1 fimbria pilin
VLGKITASGKYNKSLSAAADGSQTPDAILAEDCDATAADKVTIAYFAGQFNENSLTLGAAHTVASIKEGLRGKGIHLISATAA